MFFSGEWGSLWTRLCSCCIDVPWWWWHIVCQRPAVQTWKIVVPLYIWPMSHIGWKTKAFLYSGKDSFKNGLHCPQITWVNYGNYFQRLARGTDWMQVPQCCPESQKPILPVQWLTKYPLTRISWLRIQLFRVKWRCEKTYLYIPNDLLHCHFVGAPFAIGFYSWRNTTNGSWFVQALCYVLSERGREDDLLSLMTTVSRIVSIGFESNTPQDSNMHQRKQIPCVTSLLTRKIYFKRKTTRRIWLKKLRKKKVLPCSSPYAYQVSTTIQVRLHFLSKSFRRHSNCAHFFIC